MENTRPEQDVDVILGSLHDGLRRAEEVVATILEGIVGDSASLVFELEAALTDMEAVAATD